MSSLDVLSFSQAAKALNATRYVPSLAFFGDSITANAVGASANLFSNLAIGYATWVNILTRQRFYSPQSLNFGVSGNTVAQMLARLPQVLAARPRICIFEGGTNDADNSGSVISDVLAGYRAIFDGLANIGCTVIVIPITGRNSPKDLSANGRLRASYYNNFYRSQVGVRPNFYVADCGVTYDDPLSSTWTSRANMSYDGLHQAPLGAYTIALQVKRILDVLYPDWRAPVANIADVFDPALNPLGNLLPNGNFTGGSSTAQSTSLVTTAAGGATAVASKQVSADGRNMQRLTMSGEYSGTNCQTFLAQGTAFAGSLNPGDEIEAMVEFAAGATTGISGVYVEMRSVEGSTIYQRQGLIGQLVTDWGVTAASGIVRTPSRVIGQTPMQVTLWMGFTFISPQASATAISGQVDFLSASIRKV